MMIMGEALEGIFEGAEHSLTHVGIHQSLHLHSQDSHYGDGREEPSSQVRGGSRSNRSSSIMDQTAATRETTFLASTMAGGAALATTVFGASHRAKIVRRATFFGTALIAGTISDISSGTSPTEAITTNAIAGAAGYIAYTQARDVTPLGVEVLKNWMGKRGQGDIVEKISNATSKNKFLAGIFSSDSIGFGAAALTIPLAHLVTQRAVAAYKRTQMMPPSILPSQIDTQTGDKGGHEEGSGVAHIPQYQDADYNLSSTVRTYYDHVRARESV